MSDLVEVRISGKAVANALKANDFAQLDKLTNALAVTTRLAKTIKQRAMRGDFATQRRPYRTRGRYIPSIGRMLPFFVSEGYAEKTGAGKRKFKSSEEFHRKIGKMAGGNVTGGMWSGLRVRNFGTRAAVIEFAGKSMGSRIKKLKRGRTNQRVNVANRLKAATVWRTLKFNLIQPKDKEIQALATAIADVLGHAICFGAPLKVRGSGDRALARHLVQSIETGRVTNYL